MPRPTPVPWPPEIISMVLAYAVPVSSDPSDAALALRTQTLRSFMLVNKAWCKLVQQELFTRVALPRPSLAWKFHQTALASPKGRSLTNRTQMLRLGEYDTATLSTTDSFRNPGHRWSPFSILVSVPSLTELWIVDHGSSIDPALLSWAVGLKTLVLEEVHLILPKPTAVEGDFLWHFPHLTTLALDAVSIQYKTNDVPLSLSMLLSPLSLPKLENLALFWSIAEPFVGFSDIADQLRAVHLRRRGRKRQGEPRAHFPMLPPSLEKCGGSLIHLSTDIHLAADLPFLLSLPACLETLAIETVYHQVEQELVAFPPKSSVALLQVLYLPITDDTNPFRAETMRACGEKAIRVLPGLGKRKDDATDFITWLNELPL